MPGERNNRSVGRWAVALAATAALTIWGGYLGSVGSAYAGGKPEENVGSPGRDGQDTTCFVYRPPHKPSPDCNAVGEDGGDGAPGAVYRETAPAATPPVRAGHGPDGTQEGTA